MSDYGREQVRRLNITISSAAGTGAVTPIWSRAHWVRVIPVAETDSYDLTIKDADGDIIILRTGQIGTMSEMLDLSLGIVSTVVIANATQDGTYKVKFDMH